MQFCKNLNQYGTKMHTSPYDYASILCSPDYQIVGIVPDTVKSIMIEQTQSSINSQVKENSKYCSCDCISSCCQNKEHFKYASTNITPVSLAPSDEYESKLSFSSKLPCNSLNKYYEIKERVNYFGEINQVVVCRNSRCNMEFDNLSDFFVHERVHMKIRPYSCRYCPRAYTQKGNLLKHINILYNSYL